MSGISSQGLDRRFVIWLGFMVVLLISMIVLGGATRLTNSGLSITEWRPISGALPPLTHEHWVSEFEKYKQIPEFAAEHPDMTLKGFEFIYFMEWSHRQLGRLIGLAYAIPFFIFLFRRQLPAHKTPWFVLVLVLIGLQGAIGWWMVASGLTDDRVDVSQYRLATHLGMAFLILGIVFSLWRDAIEGWPRPSHGGGAFVAGTHAGKTYNTWPLMDGSFIPDGYGMMTPFWRNLFENIAAIQFNHRFLAYIILALAIWIFAVSKRRSLAVKRASTVLLAVLIWQIGLGIWALLWAAPLSLSLLHQFSSILVFLAALLTWRASRKENFF